MRARTAIPLVRPEGLCRLAVAASAAVRGGGVMRRGDGDGDDDGTDGGGEELQGGEKLGDVGGGAWGDGVGGRTGGGGQVDVCSPSAHRAEGPDRLERRLGGGQRLVLRLPRFRSSAPVRSRPTCVRGGQGAQQRCGAGAVAPSPM
eukprot:scaffold273360_cov24-Tisochrysis_lutea.AAC.1